LRRANSIPSALAFRYVLLKIAAFLIADFYNLKISAPEKAA
jgi:hypothetical protein